MEQIQEGKKFQGPEHELTGKIIACAMKVHAALGPGLLESAYEECLFYELNKSGVRVKKQVSQPLVYEEVKLNAGYRIDLLVEDKIILEIKAVEAINEVHIAQVLTYMKLAKCKVGFIFNFHVTSLKNGLRRFVR